MITPRMADVMQAILEFYLPRKKMFKTFAKDSGLALIGGVLIGLSIGMILLFL